MRQSFTRTLSRICALALLGFVIGAIGLLGVMPVVSKIQELRSDIEAERSKLGRLSSMPDDAGKAQSIDRLTARARESRLFLDGESDPIRLANLQALIGTIAAGQGVKLRSSRNLPARERNELRFVGIQLQFAATVEQLQKILVALEAQRPYLFIDVLHITPVPGGLGSNGDEPGQLDARLEVLGATLPQKS